MSTFGIAFRSAAAAASASAVSAPTAAPSIFFLLSRAEHARMWRRIEHLRPHLGPVLVAGFERAGSPVTHGHAYRSLGRLFHRRFLRRVPVYLRAWRQCIQPVRTMDVGYAFSLDLLLLLALLRRLTGARLRLVYEVADIHPALTRRGLRGRVLRALERVLVRRCCAVVFTSPAFRSGYFAEVQQWTAFPSVTIEHKVALPETLRTNLSFRPPREGVLVIGYLGLMKSPASFDFLARLARRAQGRVVVRFHGRFVAPLDAERCLRVINECPHLVHAGPYQSPQDLASVYGDLDLVWDAYVEGDNARWQRTTRFSEACFFKRPLLFNPDTEDGRMAQRFDLGIPVSFTDPEPAFDRILELTPARLERWFHRFEALPRSLVYYEDEYEQLLRLLQPVPSAPAP